MIDLEKNKTIHFIVKNIKLFKQKYIDINFIFILMSYSQLTNKWKLWYHSPNNNDWSINSYGEIIEIKMLRHAKPYAHNLLMSLYLLFVCSLL